MSKETMRAERLERLPPYLIARVEEKMRSMRAAGEDIISLAVGEPDFPTPQHIVEACQKAISEGDAHKYSDYSGIMEFREAISGRIREDYGVDVPTSEIIVTPGSKHAIFSTLSAYVNPGDKIGVVGPVYPMFNNVPSFLGAEAVAIPTRDDFGIDFEELEKSDAKIIILCFPNNPTGGVLEKEDVERLSEIAKRKDLTIVFDNAYEKLVYDRYKNIFPLVDSELRSRTIYIGSLSKTYAMTGWRLGYVIAPENLLKNVLSVEELNNSCTSIFTQKAGVAALEGDQSCVGEMVGEYQKRRDVLFDCLKKKFTLHKPKGAFFLFAGVDGKSLEVSERILEEAKVATVPGIGFGELGEGHVRFSFSTPIENIREAVRRLDEVL